MATSAKAARMNLRLSSVQKERYEEAAALKGQTLSQWSLEHLDSASSYELSEAKIFRVSDKEFRNLLKLLEQPMTEQTKKMIEEADQGWA